MWLNQWPVKAFVSKFKFLFRRWLCKACEHLLQMFLKGYITNKSSLKKKIISESMALPAWNIMKTAGRAQAIEQYQVCVLPTQLADIKWENNEGKTSLWLKKELQRCSMRSQQWRGTSCFSAAGWKEKTCVIALPNEAIYNTLQSHQDWIMPGHLMNTVSVLNRPI